MQVTNGATMNRPLRFSVLAGALGAEPWQIKAMDSASETNFSENIGTFSVNETEFLPGSTSVETPRNYDTKDPPDNKLTCVINDGEIGLTGDSWRRLLEGEPDLILNFTGHRLHLPEAISLPLGEWFFSSAYGPKISLRRLGEVELLEANGATSLYLVAQTANGINVLREGHFKTYPKPARTRSVATKTAQQWIRQSCQEVFSGSKSSFSEPESFKWRELPAGRNAKWRLLWKKLQGRLREQIRYRFFRQQWTIGVAESAIADVSGCAGAGIQEAALRAIKWLPEQYGTFLADPFGYLDKDLRLNILAEVYDWGRRIGEICHLTYDRGLFSNRRLVLDSPYHLSYPFVFNLDGKTLFAPEHSQARDFSAFAIEQDGKIISKRTIMGKMVPVIDGTLLAYAGTYWLFASDEKISSNTDLNIYFADSVEGPWQAHPMNPVKSDVRSARPAGTPFFFEEELYRPGQDCSSHYGRAITINKIDLLTRTSYKESRSAAVLPTDPRYGYGLHTIAKVGERTLVDGARLEPLVPLLSNLMAKLSGLSLKS